VDVPVPLKLVLALCCIYIASSILRLIQK
jgi:hypothetical protein